MTYFVSPQGSPSHKTALQARLDSIPASPYMPTGHTIQWRKNGIVVKEGSTSDSFYLGLNTAADIADVVNGVTFDATDSGAIIDFLIDPVPGPPEASLAVTLANNLPTISGAGISTDAYDRTGGRPTAIWTYSDADSDPQFFYRVRFGSSPGAGDYYDSGDVTSGAATTFSVTMPNSSTPIPNGTMFYWTIDIGDGEKVDPFDLSPSPARVTVSASGTGTVNTAPTVSNVLIDGVSSGTIQSTSPTISWTFADIDGQAQTKFRILANSGTLWDSGIVAGTTGTQQSTTYNFNLTGQSFPSHVPVTISVAAYDGIDFSATAEATVTLEGPPAITTLTVDNMVNPLRVRTGFPFFNWKYRDIDGDPLVAFEIRVADNDTLLGTDSFIGNIWNPGVVITPESYGVRFNTDGSAFSGCPTTTSLQSGIRYFFQVQIQDAFGKSEWAVGYFQLNSPPTAANLAIIPAAPFNSDDLFAVYEFVDDVGDIESDLSQIKWFRKAADEDDFSEVAALRNQRSAPASYTVPGDEWKFEVRPNDGVSFSVLSYESPTVTIINRTPTATALAISPAFPKTADNLEAIFAASDPDEDRVTVSINWFKDGEEQPELRNTKVIPASVTAVGEEWYFTVLPSDGYDNGPLAVSPTVIIGNTPPEITSISVNGEILSSRVKKQSPTIAWTYQDADMQPQQKYHVLIGTRVARTRRVTTDITRDIGSGLAPARSALLCDEGNGILSTADGDGTILAGNEIFDSGVIDSGDHMFTYVTEDAGQTGVTMDAVAFSNLNGYTLLPDLETLSLQPDQPGGTASGRFGGQTSIYDISVSYRKEEAVRSTYKLIVDGTIIGQFTSLLGTGLASYTFNAIRIDSGAIIGIIGSAVDNNAKAAFSSLSFSPVSRLEIRAGDFSLSGYLQDGTGGIKLAGLAGSATKKFSFPTGRYDIELVYVTETSGNPVLSLSINNSTLLNFVYESGAQTRSKFLTDVAISKGDTIKINGTRNAGAAARVKEIIFKPKETVKVGASLKSGIRYFVSVRAFDGVDWSEWATSKFVVSGSAWGENVSNSRGWTIETRFRVL